MDLYLKGLGDFCNPCHIKQDSIGWISHNTTDICGHILNEFPNAGLSFKQQYAAQREKVCQHVGNAVHVDSQLQWYLY